MKTLAVIIVLFLFDLYGLLTATNPFARMALGLAFLALAYAAYQKRLEMQDGVK